MSEEDDKVEEVLFIPNKDPLKELEKLYTPMSAEDYVTHEIIKSLKSDNFLRRSDYLVTSAEKLKSFKEINYKFANSPDVRLFTYNEYVVSYIKSSGRFTITYEISQLFLSK